MAEHLATEARAGAAVTSAAVAVLTATYAGARRAQALGAFGALAAASFVVGPLVAGTLTDLAGWRLVFLANLPLGLAVAAVAGRVLAESRSPATHPRSPAAASRTRWPGPASTAC
jgi:MFS family permease